ncbi:MAG: P-loop NTPase fold protein, partial [Bacteroidota bacterium]
MAAIPDDDGRYVAVQEIAARLQANAEKVEKSPRPLILAGFSSDQADGVDALGVGPEAEILMSVLLADEVKPPLAVGLFGDWGTGKSFFMGEMRKATKRLLAQAQEAEDAAFCQEVVEVEFNAWHYVDTDLMASLVSHILERLAHHVSPLPTDEEQEAELTEARKQALAVVTNAEADRASAEKQKEKRRSQLVELHQLREEKERQLRSLRLGHVVALLSKDDKNKAKAALTDLGLPAVAESVDDLRRAASEVESLWGRSAGLARGLLSKDNRLVLTLTILGLVIGPLVALGVEAMIGSEFIASASGVFTQITAAILGTAASLRKASGWVSERVKQIETAKTKAENALAARLSQPTEDEKELEAEIAALVAEETAAAGRLAAAAAEVEALDEKIQAIREGRTLAAFLGERLRSDDYHKHLGLTATIRRDFETLQKRLMPSEDGALPEGTRHVDRIVLYIDDLDRCPEDRVMEVLQAVHLLLAYPLFVVVVGVDPRWLLHALRSTYSAFDRDTDDSELDDDEWVTTPQNYLEKIFQIPFALRPMGETGFGDLMTSLLTPAEAAPPASRPEATDTTEREEPTPPSPEETEPTEEAPTDSASAEPQPEPEAETEVQTPTTLDRPSVPLVRGQALSIRPHEAEFAAGLHGLIRTPRAVKRFTNVYRLLKAPVGSRM